MHTLQLLLIDDCEGSPQACKVWQMLCERRGLELKILTKAEAEGRVLVDSLNLKAFPALIHQKEIIAIGQPNEEEASAILDRFVQS